MFIRTIASLSLVLLLLLIPITGFAYQNIDCTQLAIDLRSHVELDENTADLYWFETLLTRTGSSGTNTAYSLPYPLQQQLSPHPNGHLYDDSFQIVVDMDNSTDVYRFIIRYTKDILWINHDKGFEISDENVNFVVITENDKAVTLNPTLCYQDKKVISHGPPGSNTWQLDSYYFQTLKDGITYTGEFHTFVTLI